MKGQKRSNPKKRYIMRWFLSIIFVMVTLSSASAIETRTEIITEEVCHAIAGCWMNPLTGECPDCVTETREIVTVIENEPVVKERIWEFDKVEPHKEITRKGDICFYSELGWVGDDGKPTGEWRACDWDVNYTAIAVEKGTIECGGYDNIVWTNSNLTEYECNEG